VVFRNIKYGPYLSAVDKLDKVGFGPKRPWACSLNGTQLPWAEVRKEMTEEKGLDPMVADKIGDYVKLKGTSYATLLLPGE